MGSEPSGVSFQIHQRGWVKCRPRLCWGLLRITSRKSASATQPKCPSRLIGYAGTQSHSDSPFLRRNFLTKIVILLAMCSFRSIHRAMAQSPPTLNTMTLQLPSRLEPQWLCNSAASGRYDNGLNAYFTTRHATPHVLMQHKNDKIPHTTPKCSAAHAHTTPNYSSREASVGQTLSFLQLRCFHA